MNIVDTKFVIFRDEMINYYIVSEDTTMCKKVSRFQLADIDNPMFREIIYSLPVSYQSKYQNLYIKKRQLEYRGTQLNNEVSDQNFRDYFIMVLLFVGEIFCVSGLLIWYLDTKEEKRQKSQERLSLELLSEVCHSCYKQFVFADERGKNYDGTMSISFCKECYLDGSYTEIELTFEEALQRLKNKLEELNYRPKKIKNKLKDFKNLRRWRREKVW